MALTRGPISCATPSSASCLRPQITTCAPSRANTSAIERPMPRLAPVTSATWPSSCPPIERSGYHFEIMAEPLTEAWMRGPIPGVDPLLAPVLYSFQQAREDLARFTDGLTPEQIWARPHGFGSVGFHLRHI